MLLALCSAACLLAPLQGLSCSNCSKGLARAKLEGELLLSAEDRHEERLPLALPHERANLLENLCGALRGKWHEETAAVHANRPTPQALPKTLQSTTETTSNTLAGLGKRCGCVAPAHIAERHEAVVQLEPGLGGWGPSRDLVEHREGRPGGRRGHLAPTSRRARVVAQERGRVTNPYSDGVVRNVRFSRPEAKEYSVDGKPI